MALVYTNNSMAEKEFVRILLHKTAEKKFKYLGISLTKISKGSVMKMTKH